MPRENIASEKEEVVKKASTKKSLTKKKKSAAKKAVTKKSLAKKKSAAKKAVTKKSLAKKKPAIKKSIKKDPSDEKKAPEKEKHTAKGEEIHMTVDEKLVYVYENINELTLDQRKKCVQMLLGEQSIDEKKIKEVGEGMLIPTDMLTNPVINALFTYVYGGLNYEEDQD